MPKVVPLLAIVLCLVASVITASALRLSSRDQYTASQTYEDVYYLPPAEWLPVVSLGHQEALADLIWARSLVYFGEEIAHRGTVHYVFEYAEAMLALDPDFLAVYRWIPTAALYGDVELTADEVRRTVAIMERGLDRFPEDGRLAWDIGATLAFELPPLIEDPAEEDRARADAAPYLMLATRLGAAPAWSALSNASLLRRLGQAETAAQHLEEMYAMAQDEETRAQIHVALASLRSQQHADAIAGAVREEEQARQRSYPYVHPDLFPLLAPRPGESWQEVYRDGFGRDPEELALEQALTGEL